jgi:hypothetical protein
MHRLISRLRRSGGAGRDVASFVPEATMRAYEFKLLKYNVYISDPRLDQENGRLIYEHYFLIVCRGVKQL